LISLDDQGNLTIETPRHLEPMLYPKRYKGLKGGRGCVHPDTLIDTPSGQVKIRDFKGGAVYSWHNGDLVIAIATEAYECSEEDLFDVELECGRKIIATDEHKFLTTNGWVELRDLSMCDEVVTLPCQELSYPLQTNSDNDPQEFPANGQHLKQKYVDYQGYCLLYLHQYDLRPQSLKDNALFCPQQQDDEQLHSPHALFYADDLEFAYINILSLTLSHHSTSAVLPCVNFQYYANMGNYTYEKTFVQPLEFSQSSRLSPQKETHLSPYQELKMPLLCPYISKNQARTLEMQYYKPQPYGHDNFSLYAPIKKDTFIISKIRHISKHSRLKYWDLHVYNTNNYLSNGIVNHNSGKSHFFAEDVVERMILDDSHCVVCIREIQKSLKFSAKKLVEDKIREFNASHLFDITLTEIRRIGGTGVMIFQGMQDHTADSIKSLEGFNTAWVEEAQSISARSLELLLPTIRAEGSEILFSWNPNEADDPVEQLFIDEDDNSICIHVNYTQNKLLPQTLKDEADRHLRNNPDTFSHVWLGEYRKMSEAQIFKNYEIREIDPPYGTEFIFGADWGYANDPNAINRLWIEGKTIYIDYEAHGEHTEIDDIPELWETIPEIKKYNVRADCARPELISHMKRKGFRVTASEKGAGSVEAGISFLLNYKIVIHPRCHHTIKEFSKYSYKVHRLTGDILPDVVDAWNHHIDGIRYGIEPLIKNKANLFANMI